MVEQPQTQQRQKGFTLVEVIIVVMILAMLSGLAVLALANANKSSLKAACKTDFQIVTSAKGAYLNDKTALWTNNDLYGTTAELITQSYMNALTDTKAYKIFLTALDPAAAKVEVRPTINGVLGPLPASYTATDPELPYSARACELLTGTTP